MKNYALFSTNGRFIGYTNFKPQNGLYKELPDNFNPVLEVYVGDYETGSIKTVHEINVKDRREANIDHKWKVFESDINNNVGEVITKTLNLPLHKQLNAIMEVLYKNQDKLELTDDFKEIYENIEKVRHNHKNSLEVYKQAPKADVILKEQEDLFIEEYTLQQLNIKDEPVSVTVVEE
jgi:hypothetical protein